jgi:SNF2 family DNA or RNA helicase
MSYTEQESRTKMAGHVEELRSGISLPAPLRQYQWDGVNFLLSTEAALLADEMGLGKTVQTSIALRLAMRKSECNRALIVAPASLRVNWEREIRHWAPDLAVRRVIGNARDRAATYQLPIPVLIVSYEQVRNDMGLLDSSVHFDIVVLDEAQRIKNAGSGASLACKLLPRSVSWALTGTPVENAIDDLVSIYSYVKPQLLQAGLPRHLVHERIQPYFLRRRKQEVLNELPPIILQDLPLELDGSQLEAYETVWASRERLVSANGLPASEAHLFAVITKLKQICNYERESGESAKLDALKLILENAQATDDKIIIFSQYVETLQWVSERLNLPLGLFHGGLPEPERQRVLSEFEAEPGPRALLISLRAGGVGLNLNAASMVVLFDRWWNPAVENQAIQRAHRFGRTVPLQVVRFLVEDTIEDRIAELLAHKEDLFRSYVDEAESWKPTRFTREELRQILQLSEAQVG